MAGFFKQLKRRHVARAGFIYAIIGWILVEMTAPALQAPGWLLRAPGLLLLLGLPVTLVLAWRYTWTPRGLKKKKDIDHSPSPGVHSRQQPSQHLNFLIMALVLVAMGVMWFKLVHYTNSARQAPPTVTTRVG